MIADEVRFGFGPCGGAKDVLYIGYNLKILDVQAAMGTFANKRDSQPLMRAFLMAYEDRIILLCLPFPW